MCGSIYQVTHAQSFRIEDFKKNFSKKEWFKINGNISATGTYYAANPSYDRLPWNYFLSASVNFSLFNTIQIPFSVDLTNSGLSYTYPNLPNRFAIHPSYKWITLHVGDISLNYSPYTLGGHQFTGIGVELSPSKWNASVMFGRMQKAVEYDSLNTVSAVPAAYKRLGIGANLKYDNGLFYLGGNVFVAKDDLASLSWKPDSLGILPQQNIAASVEAGIKLFKSLQLSASYAFSFLQRDIRIESNPLNFYNAIKAGIDYTIKTHQIGVHYERIDPEYKSLGAYYFDNDRENITIQYSGSMINQKLSLALKAGIERNDLDGSVADKQMRFVGSFNASYNPTETLQFSAGYSNFQNYQRVKSQFDYINEYDISENSDTLSYSQVSHQANLTASYRLSEKDVRAHSFNFNSSFQLSKDQYTDTVHQSNLTRMLNTALAYQLQFILEQVGLNISMNYTASSLLDQISNYFGPTIACNACFFDKSFNIATSISCNVGYIAHVYQQFISNARISFAYTLHKKHRFTLSGIGQYKKQLSKDNSYLASASLSYSYTF